MIKYFKGSIIVTILGFVAAWFWAGHIAPGYELKALFVVFFLSVLEVTLSFDNAVVNAVTLEKMDPKWQHRFITWGIIIAVFGVRFLLPVLMVSFFSGHSIINTVNIAFNDVTEYTHYLELAHAPLVAFGGSFLLMVGLSYFTGKSNEHKWLKFIETVLEKIKFKFASVLICFIAIFIVSCFLNKDIKLSVVSSAIIGVLAYEIIHFITAKMEASHANTAKSGLMMFVYLEVLDASFSLDGVLGSFAISKDIVIIAIGLMIGAMFVRSLTIMLVDKKTLANYVYLVSGAHFAILSLAIIMLVSIFVEVSEIITGSIGLILVLGSFISSLIEAKKCAQEN